MAKKEKKGKIGIAEGISAGLKLWLFFLIFFVLLRYPIRLSILLGAVGGFAGGWAMAWWKSQDEPQRVEIDAQVSQETTRISGFRKAKLRRDAIKARKERKSIRSAAMSLFTQRDRSADEVRKSDDNE